MAQDWSADVKKYAPEADDGIIAGIVRHCGISLHKVDSALVSFSDKTETDRVRDGFCRKKLALTQDDAELDRVIASVGERMKADRTKNRVTVYYLLAEAFDKLQLFAKAAPAAKATSDTGAAAAVLGTGAAMAAGASDGASPLLVKKGAARAPDLTVPDDAVPVAEPVTEPVTSAAPDPVVDPVAKSAPVFGTATAAAGAVAAGLGAVGGSTINSEPLVTPSRAADLPPATATADPVTPPVSRREQYISTPEAEEVVEGGGGSMKWLPWLLLALGVAALLWYFLIHRPNEAAEDAAPVATMPVTTVAPTVETNAATTTTTAVTIPTGAGVTSETIDGKQAVNVYFDTAKTAVAPAFAAAAAAVKTYLDANPAATLAVSGYNDKTGNAAANAELSKNRAQAVQAALVAAGIPVAAVALVKPADTTDTGVVDDSAARRVEVRIK